MAGGNFIFNLGTSIVFGPLKYGYKLLAEPENRVRNSAFLATSLLGLSVLGDVVEAASESGADYMNSYSGNAIDNRASTAAIAEYGSFFALALKQQAAENQLETINDHLVNSYHPETGVPFMEQQVETNSNSMVGVFPAFESYYDVQLPREQYLASDHVQFKTANRMLYADILYDPSIADELELTNQETEDLIKGLTPEGYTWHHNEDSGSLQLVSETIHSKTAHTGGRELWGGGELYR